jgi:hypothetical protein
MTKKTERTFLFYFVLIVVSGIIFKAIEYLTGFPYNYFDSSSVVGFILHISLYTLVFFPVYFLLKSSGLFTSSKKETEELM